MGYLLLAFLILSSLFLCAVYRVYSIKLQRNRQCVTEYILSDNTVECGKADSLRYEKMKIAGSKEDGDSRLGLVEAYSVEERDLESRFYTELHKPAMDGGNVPFPFRHLLLGWKIYTWFNSKIYGYCCITNNNDTRQTATINMFTDDHDAINFMNGGPANNAILSETIDIPPGREVCFEKWGTNVPFTVTQNAYHYIVVDLPAQTNFTSKVTVLQRTVNTTGLKSPHYFRYDNATELNLKWPISTHREYVAVCKSLTDEHALLEPNETDEQSLVVGHENETDVQSLASTVGAESLHIKSCNVPYHWMKVSFGVTLGVGIVGVLVFSGLFVFFCLRMCKYHRDKLIGLQQLCKSRNQPSRDGGPSYGPIGSDSSSIQGPE